MTCNYIVVLEFLDLDLNILELLSSTISNLQADKENFLDFGSFKVSVCFPELVASHGKSKCTQLHCEDSLRPLNQMKMLTWIIQAPVVVFQLLICRCRCFHTLSHVYCLQATGWRFICFDLKALLKNLTLELQLLPAMLDQP